MYGKHNLTKPTIQHFNKKSKTLQTYIKVSDLWKLLPKGENAIQGFEIRSIYSVLEANFVERLSF